MTEKNLGLGIRMGLLGALLLGSVLAAGAARAQQGNLLLWDGESPFKCGAGQRIQAETFRGEYCFQGTNDGHYDPEIMLYGLSTNKADISGYDEVWFFAKADQPVNGFVFRIEQYPVYSATVNIDNYVVKPSGATTTLDTSYRLVRIPISALATVDCPLTKIDWFSFPPPNASYNGHVVYIDEIWAVHTGAAGAAYSSPVVGPLPPAACPDAAVKTSSQKEVSVSNIGNATLNVTGVTLSGTNGSEFSVSPTALTVEPGQSGKLTITFSPSTPGDKSATVTLAHNSSALGNTTAMKVSGKGTGATLQLAATELDFGTVLVGYTTSWPVTVANPGNLKLDIATRLSGATSPFSATPATLSVEAGGSATLTVALTCRTAGAAGDTLTLTSNDANQPSVAMALNGTGVQPNLQPGGSGPKNLGGVLPLVIGKATSSAIPLSWPHVDGAQEVRVYIGPEPSANPNQPLGVQMLLATLPGDATGYTLTKIAAAVDVFIRVESCNGSQDVLASGNGYARTLGGPLAPLDEDPNDLRSPNVTHVREVHMMAPDVLVVVLENPHVKSYTGTTGTLVDFSGPGWQAGPWTVTRHDGAAIAVKSVFRHSIPVGQYDINRGTPDPHIGSSDNVQFVDVDHRIFLALGEAVGNQEILHVQGPSALGTDFYVPFSDRYLETPAIQVNQVGYSPRATRRYAYVSGWLGDGGPLSMANFPAKALVLAEPESPSLARTVVVQNLPISVRSANDTDAGGEVREVDLASVPPAEGTVYRVQVPGVGVSWPTQVSNTAVFKAFYTIMRGIYFNRWGRDLRPECTEFSPRPPDHPTVYTAEFYDAQGKPRSGLGANFPANPPKVGERPMTGGHHDAGDFDLQEHHVMIGLTLSRPFEINPQAFVDSQLTIPESGNGIPDILDEILYEVKSWEQLQEDDGGVRAGAQYAGDGAYIPLFADEDPYAWFTYSRDPGHTARVAGLFACASRLVRPYDPARADELQQRAIRAFDYAVANGVDASSEGTILYASSELFRLTGNTRYSDAFESTCDYLSMKANYVHYIPINSRYPLPTETVGAFVPNCADFMLGYLQGSTDRTKWYYTTTTSFIARAAANTGTAFETGHAFRTPRGNAGPGWGLSVALGEFLPSTLAELQLSDQIGLAADAKQDILNQVSLCVDVFLGCNPSGMVWVTRLGSRYPTNPLHADALAFWAERRDLLPGITVFGEADISGQWYCDYGRNVFYPAYTAHPRLRKYADLKTFVNNNEGGANVNALHAELLGVLLPPGMKPPASWLPRGPESLNPLAPREGIVAQPSGPDTTPPVPGTATAPAVSNQSPITVAYTDTGDAGSGLKEVRLWVKKGTSGTWQDTGMAVTAPSGSFAYAAMSGDDVYYFAMRAQDNAGNFSAMPSGAGSATTKFDTTPPDPGKLTSSPYSRQTPISVTYSGVQDTLSGVKEVRLWIKKGQSGAWQDTGLRNTATAGKFDYTQATEDDAYFFFLQAVDQTGNLSKTPTDMLVFGQP